MDPDDAAARSRVGKQLPNLQKMEEAGEDDVIAGGDFRWISRQRVEEQRSEADTALLLDLRNGNTEILDIALDECSSWRGGMVDRRDVLRDCLTQSLLTDIASACPENILGQPLADLLGMQTAIVKVEPGCGERASSGRAGDKTQVDQRLVGLGHRVAMDTELCGQFAGSWKPASRWVESAGQPVHDVGDDLVCSIRLHWR